MHFTTVPVRGRIKYRHQQIQLPLHSKSPFRQLIQFSTPLVLPRGGQAIGSGGGSHPAEWGAVVNSSSHGFWREGITIKRCVVAAAVLRQLPPNGRRRRSPLWAKVTRRPPGWPSLFFSLNPVCSGSEQTDGAVWDQYLHYHGGSAVAVATASSCQPVVARATYSTGLPKPVGPIGKK